MSASVCGFMCNEITLINLQLSHRTRFLSLFDADNPIDAADCAEQIESGLPFDSEHLSTRHTVNMILWCDKNDTSLTIFTQAIPWLGHSV